MTRRDIPNLISAFRILLVWPVIMALLNADYGLALLLFIIAGVSDGIDGFLARHNGWGSRLGAILDPLADKLLMTSVYIVLAWLGHFPWWLTALVIGRDMLIVSGGLAYHYFIGQFEIQATMVSKLNTVFQISLVVVMLFSLWISNTPPWLVESLAYTVIASTLLSGLNYMWVWGRQAILSKKLG
ncbi:MAG: CDP-alcohol phosphatidyltransferase family protein [Gammaproteobacteria bacterium]|nr:CDP-alcohol phosphatidyltransferase family protein [Gammaproteobacteria bacterium]